MFDTTTYLDCAGKRLALDRPQVMGIVNVTPDSFSDGGAFYRTEDAIAHGLQLVAEGANVLDIGGESTRPGAVAVSVEEELQRVIPVISALAAQIDVPISVDTSKAEVMRQAVAAGAGMINDVCALQQEGALHAAAGLGVPVVLMHMQGSPAGMQTAPSYDDVIGQVQRFLTERVFACEMAGIARQKLIVDVGFGFGKTTAHNLQLLAALAQFKTLGLPLLAGLSRKRSIGEITQRTVPDARVYGSVAAHLLAVQNGAWMVRVHDVAATVDALKVQQAVAQQAMPKRTGSAVGGADAELFDT